MKERIKMKKVIVKCRLGLVDDNCKPISQYSIVKVKGVDCPSKYLILKGSDPFMFTNSRFIATLSIAYLNTGERGELTERITKYIDRVRRACDDCN